jgi:competence protein ComEC
MSKRAEKGFDFQSQIANHLSGRPAAALALAFSAGIAFSLVCRAYCFSGLAVATISLLGAACLALRKNRLTLSLAVGLAAIALGGFLMALAHRDGFSASDLRHLIRRDLFPIGEPVSFEGCVIEDGQRRGEETSSTIEMKALWRNDQWIPCAGKGMLRVVEPPREESSVSGASLIRGDRIRGWAIWNVPRNYENPGSADRVGQLARRGIYLLGRVKSPRLLERIPGGCSNPWSTLASSVRAHVHSTLAPINSNERGQPAAILASLIIGDYSGLDNLTREVFQNSGTYHVLVVSGLHVAWIAGLLLQLFKLSLVPERIRYLLAALAILLYTCVVGFQASISRCLWMFILYLTGRMIFRAADSTNILFSSALVLLAAQPDWLFDAGFQLSFLAVMAIAMTAVPAMNRYLKPVCEPLRNSGNPDRLFFERGRWHRYGRRLRTRCEILVEGMTDTLPPPAFRILLRICRGAGSAGLAIGSVILASASVQIWLAPLLALNFNRLSWISPLANLIMVPFSSIVLAAGITASFAALLPRAGSGCLWLAGTLSSKFLHTAGCITNLSGSWQRCPTPSPAWVLAGIFFLFLWSFFKWRRFWIPCIFVGALLACLSRSSVPALDFLSEKCRDAVTGRREEIWERKTPILSFTFLDVGEGDAIVIRFPDKRIWLLDAGGLRLAPSFEENTHAFDIGEAVVSRYFWHFWISELDRLILSHTDQDHVGGMPAMFKNFRIARFDYAQAGSEAILAGILKTAREKHAAVRLLQGGMEETAGSVLVRTLNPPANSSLNSANESSLVLQVLLKNFSGLLTGDLEKSGEREVLSQTGNLRSQLLKVAHHGSRWGTSNAFLDRVQPRWAIISAGRNNPFGHPSREAMLRLRQHGAQVFLTFDEGAITFETDGSRYIIRSHVRGILERGTLR